MFGQVLCELYGRKFYSWTWPCGGWGDGRHMPWQSISRTQNKRNTLGYPWIMQEYPWSIYGNPWMIHGYPCVSMTGWLAGWLAKKEKKCSNPDLFEKQEPPRNVHYEGLRSAKHFKKTISGHELVEANPTQKGFIKCWELDKKIIDIKKHTEMLLINR